MVGRGPRDRMQRLDHVQAVHFRLRALVVQPATGGEFAGVLDGQRRAAAEQIGIQAHDDLGIGQFEHRQHILAESGQPALANVVLADCFVFIPLGFGKFVLKPGPHCCHAGRIASLAENAKIAAVAGDMFLGPLGENQRRAMTLLTLGERGRECE